jgi:hypothetical protein
MFKLIKILNGRMNVPEPEFLPITTAEEYKEGETLKLASGKVTKASGTTAPSLIALGTESKGGLLPVARIDPSMVFEVPVTYSSTPNAIVLGTKLTITDDGIGVTDVTTSGVATVVDTLDANKTAGDKVLVIFE